MVSGVASTLPNLAAKPKRRGQSLVELPLINPSIADRLARRAPNSYMLSGKQMEEAMGMLIIRHKVKDYGKWRPMFDKHSLMQKAAGLSNPRVFRSADDKSEIVVVFDTYASANAVTTANGATIAAGKATAWRWPTGRAPR